MFFGVVNMVNAAVIIVVLTTLLIHCGHCQQRVTFSALQDAPKALHSLNVRSISNRQSPGCMQRDFDNILAQACGLTSVQINSLSDLNQHTAVICQQQCHDALLAFFTRCNTEDNNYLRDGTNFLRALCTGNNAGTPNAGTHNAGSSAEAPTFFKALFLLVLIVMAMLLL